MRAAVIAGTVYFAAVFLIGFLVGTVRVLLVAPRLGDVGAVLLETPVVVAASWILARRSVRRFAAPRGFGPRATMGAVAFALLMTAELAVSMFAFGRTPGEHLAIYGTPAGAIGLAAQLVFAVLPMAA